MTVVIGGLPGSILNIIQDNTLSRYVKDVLFEELLFRAEATAEKWVANLGDSMLISRSGRLPLVTAPLVPGFDPAPQQYNVEQFRVTASQYGSAILTHMPTARTTIVSKLLLDTQKLGEQAGASLNRIVRNRLFRAYCGGHTVALAVAAIGAWQVRVASLNGFTECQLNGRPPPVSAANPLGVTFGGAAGEPANTVVAATPDNPAQPFGPGTLTMGAALTAGLAARDAVMADNRPTIVRVGGGNSVDAIGAGDTLRLQDVINAAAILGGQNVKPHASGFYNHHLSTFAMSQIYGDQAWRDIHDGQAESDAYTKFRVGRKVGCDHIRNTQCPDSLNSGALVATGAGGAAAAFCAPDLGAEVINNNGQRIGRTIITGRGALMEMYIDEAEYLSEAGATGKIGDFTVMNDGVQVVTDRIRYILRAPLDMLQQVVSQAWSWSGDVGVPTDELADGGAATFRRAVVIEHAL